MSKLSSELEKVKKKFKVEAVSVKDSGKIERFSLDSPGLNFVLGGGWAKNRIYYFQGPESGGKSTLATYIASQVQKHYDGHNAVVYVDFEYSFDVEHAMELGLDISEDKFILLRPNNGEDAFNALKDIIATNEVGLVVIDSITTMPSASQVEDAFNGFGGGKGASMLSNGLRLINPYLYNNNCSMILISQERANVGAMYGADFKGTGGYAPRYYASWMSRVTRTADITDPNTKELIGIEMRVRNTKNKIGIPKRDASLKLYFHSGINSDDEYIDYLKVLGLIEQKGAYYSNPNWTSDDGVVGMKVCGLEAVREYLHNNPKLYESVKLEVNNLICGYSILDTDTSSVPDDPDDLMEADSEEKE